MNSNHTDVELLNMTPLGRKALSRRAAPSAAGTASFARTGTPPDSARAGLFDGIAAHVQARNKGRYPSAEELTAKARNAFAQRMLDATVSNPDESAHRVAFINAHGQARQHYFGMLPDSAVAPETVQANRRLLLSQSDVGRQALAQAK